MERGRQGAFRLLAQHNQARSSCNDDRRKRKVYPQKNNYHEIAARNGGFLFAISRDNHEIGARYNFKIYVDKYKTLIYIRFISELFGVPR